jgi:hypothetical protein
MRLLIQLLRCSDRRPKGEVHWRHCICGHAFVVHDIDSLDCLADGCGCLHFRDGPPKLGVVR